MHEGAQTRHQTDAPSAATCRPGEVCAIPQVRTAYKLIFWIVVALVLIALGFPYVLPRFY